MTGINISEIVSRIAGLHNSMASFGVASFDHDNPDASTIYACGQAGLICVSINGQPILAIEKEIGFLKSVRIFDNSLSRDMSTIRLISAVFLALSRYGTQGFRASIAIGIDKQVSIVDYSCHNIKVTDFEEGFCWISDLI
jgi:hypothetical protein